MAFTGCGRSTRRINFLSFQRALQYFIYIYIYLYGLYGTGYRGVLHLTLL